MRRPCVDSPAFKLSQSGLSKAMSLVMVEWTAWKYLVYKKQFLKIKEEEHERH
jgi:hypothetical protein